MNAMNWRRRASYRTAIITAAFCFATYGHVAAQDKPSAPASTAPAASAPANSANPAAFTYDVVSIKPYKAPDAGISMYMNSTKDGFTSRGFPVQNLIFNAFPVVTLDQVIGLPAWAGSDPYDIQAKMDEETAAAFNKLPRDRREEVYRSLMLGILTDRFHLRYHKETRELPIYNLVIAKGGLRIQPTPKGKQTGYRMGPGEISGNGIALDSIAMSLAGEVGRVVVNKTGLDGEYGVQLHWQADSMAAAANAPSSSTSLPDLFTALQEQLGLKLEPAKGPVDVYVIDHIEKPSPD